MSPPDGGRAALLAAFVGLSMVIGTRMTMAGEQRNEAVIYATRTGSVAGEFIGVFAVTPSPLVAKIGVAGTSAGTNWETTQTVSAGQEMLGLGTRLRVTHVAPGTPGSRSDYGSVGVALIPGPDPWPPAAVALTADGPIINSDSMLRLDGPDVTNATDARVIAWLPDRQHPTAAQVQWWPARWGLAGNLPQDIKVTRVAPGDRVTLGRVPVRVLAVQGDTPEHPARVIFELLPR